MRHTLRAIVGTLAALAWLAALAGSAHAQGLSLPDSVLPKEQQASDIPDQVDGTLRTRWSSGTYGPVSREELDRAAGELPPFGANLFKGGFRGTMADGMNPSYRIKPGDQVTLRAWGAVDIEQVAVVDAQGNLFIPSIGPLAVQGANSGQLDEQVRTAIEQVYPENVEVYTNLQGVQPVGVFVTGYVTNPGRYAGTPSDSLLYFLDQAGGIDEALGSYRRIHVKRDSSVIASVDLYDFLIDGSIPRPQFRDGDTIVVEERGPDIAVVGDVQREYRYELLGDRLSGSEVLRLARLKAGVTHALLRGTRNSGPIAEYFPLAEFSAQSVRRGDEVLFSADQRDETIVVQVEGSYYGPSRYALPRNAHLGELLDAIAVPEMLTAVDSVSLKRESVAAQQARSLEDSLRRLETTYLSASSATDEEARIRVREAELIQTFIERARQVEPSGRLVVAHNGQISDIRLQNGDIVTIPEITDSILISGEVVVPQAMVFKPGMSAEGYIKAAGGYTQRADDDNVLVVSQNGAVRNVEDVDLRAGDEILIMPAVPTKNLQLATSITQILYQIAVATKVAVDL